MLNRREIGSCGGSDRVYPEPLWFGGKPEFSRGKLRDFLEALKKWLPVMPWNFPISLSSGWEQTLQEKNLVDEFNEWGQKVLASPIGDDERLLVHRCKEGVSVWLRGNNFIVSEPADHVGTFNHKVVKVPSGLTKDQAKRAVDEWQRRRNLK